MLDEVDGDSSSLKVGRLPISADGKPNHRKNEAEIAIVLSWLVPGLGHMYLGRFVPGLAFSAVFFALAVPAYVGALSLLTVLLPVLIVWVASQVALWRALGARPTDYFGTRNR